MNIKAFPNGITTNSDGVIVGGQLGMDLRDYFAGQVLAGLSANTNFNITTDSDFISRICYSMADAMLFERSEHE